MKCASFAILLAVACPAGVAGQPVDPEPGRLEIAAGGARAGGYALGDRPADLVGNGVPTGGTFLLFETETDAAAATFLEVHLGYRLTRFLVIEGRFAHGQPRLETAISRDAEAAAVRLQTEIAHYELAGDVRLDLTRLTFGEGRGRPFVITGLGYLRELSEDRTTAETGTVAHVGGGVRYLLAVRAGLVKTWGLRADVRVQFQSAGLDIAGRVRTYPIAGGGMFVGF
jgi:hypothetical protein